MRFEHQLESTRFSCHAWGQRYRSFSISHHKRAFPRRTSCSRVRGFGCFGQSIRRTWRHYGYQLSRHHDNAGRIQYFALSSKP